MMNLIDLSHPLTNQTPPFPGDPPVAISVLASTDQTGPEERTSLNCGQLTLPIHCATHMDAPFHFYADRPTIEQIPLDWCSGPACKLDILAQPVIDRAHLQPHQALISRHPRVILNTGWYQRWGQDDFFTEHPVLTKSAAQFLVDCRVRLVGVDFPSVDRPPHEAHLTLLGNDVLIVENLTNLNAITAATFEFSAFPLAVAGRDGSPVRAVARL
ncbi:MAG: arylformamidase [Candidatus Latescibacteria bacterium]|nr:arylformamidase [Candidatus Latescibacterota bacterium]